MNVKITIPLRDFQLYWVTARIIEGYAQRPAFLVDTEGRKGTPSVTVDGRKKPESRRDVDFHDQAGVGAPENWRRSLRFVGYCSMDFNNVSIASFGFMRCRARRSA